MSCYGFLSDRLLAALQAEHTQRARAYAGQLTRAEYEARLAKRQYLAIDPDNRLVAAALERRWEMALRAVAATQEAAERFAAQPAAPTLAPSVKEQLRDPDIWR